MATNYTVTITLTDSTDPNGPNHFNYAPGYLRVHHEDHVRFSCNRPFLIKFLHGSPFGSITEFSNDSAVNTASAEVKDVSRQAYHYLVAAIGSDGVPHVDGGCPTLDVG